MGVSSVVVSTVGATVGAVVSVIAGVGVTGVGVSVNVLDEVGEGITTGLSVGCFSSLVGVGEGVSVGVFGTYNRSPGWISVPVRQLANIKSERLTP